MPPIEMPMNTAHQHAANADDFLAKGLLIPASEEHYKAAEAYLTAVERTSDDKTKRTLRMLYNDHCKAGKELQRKILKLREENKDPSLPQKPDPQPMTPVADNSANLTNYAPQPVASPPPSAHRMSDSQSRTDVDESFMLLGQRSDPGDAFNQFWQIMEGMLDKLSQPVAFATAPLGEAIEAQRAGRTDGSLSSDTDIEDPMVTRISRKIGMGKDKRKNDRSLGAAGSKLALTGAKQGHSSAVHSHEEEFDVDVFDEGDELSESFCLIPSGSEPSPLVLKKENANLKVEMEAMQKRLAATERVLQLRKEQDQQLKDSIVMARREAHRAMGASALLQQRPGQATIDFGGLNINVPPVGTPMPVLAPGRDRESQLLRRVRELEEEMRTLRVENEKQKAMIAKFRERWEKLKESAKRKKDAKAAAGASTPAVQERIEEEPEAEQEQEQDLDGSNSY